MSVVGQCLAAFIFGSAVGFLVQRSRFCNTAALRDAMLFKTYRNTKALLVTMMILTVGFTTFMTFGDGYPLRFDVGVNQVIGLFLFGIGMQLGGGCGSGTLYTMGQGQVDMLITLVFFIIGATLGSAHLQWWLSLPGVGSVSLIETFGWWQSLLIQFVLLAALYALVRSVELKRNGTVSPVEWQVARAEFSQRLIHGPWPLWWGVLGLAVLNLATLLVAGHPWSITYAFGLWGAKIWAAIGGDPGSWAYWSSGYPAESLNNSVLADTTSVMNFGIILGALLASALAGKYAPAMKLPHPARLHPQPVQPNQQIPTGKTDHQQGQPRQTGQYDRATHEVTSPLRSSSVGWVLAPTRRCKLAWCLTRVPRACKHAPYG